MDSVANFASRYVKAGKRAYKKFFVEPSFGQKWYPFSFWADPKDPKNLKLWRKTLRKNGILSSRMANLYRKSFRRGKRRLGSSRSTRTTATSRSAYGRGRKYRRVFRGRRRTFRRGSRKSFRRSGLPRTVGQLLKQMYPIHNNKTSTFFHSHSVSNTVSHFSMEIGNYDDGTMTAGQGCKSPWSSVSTLGVHSNSGSLNQMVTDTSVFAAGQRREVLRQTFGMNLQNNTNLPVIVKAYWCKLRLSEGSPGYLTFEQRWRANAITDGIGLTTPPTQSPFDSKTFVSQNKILKSRTFKLGAGEAKTLYCSSPLRGGLTYEQMIDEPCSNKWMRGLLVFHHGITMHDALDPGQVAMGPSALDIRVDGKISWRLGTTYASKMTYATVNSGALINPEGGIGNAGNPDVWTET